MSLITLFSAPKPFTDPHIAMIQRNAIKSWTLLPDVEVILLGEETGLAEAARELGVKHLPNVARNESGTPLISSMFQLARKIANSDLLCIINADMILMPDFVEAAEIKLCKLKDKFVLLSQRWDLDVTNPSNFSKAGRSSIGPSSIVKATSPSRRKRLLPLPNPLITTFPISPSVAQAGTTG